MLLILELLRGGIWADLVATALLGILIGSFAVGFADHWSGNTVIYRWVALGALFGLLAGLSGGVLAGVLQKLVGPAAGFRMVSWSIVGLFIGAGIGIRSWDVNRARLLYSLLGGVAGGALGGAVFMGLGSLLPEYNEAIGYVLLGIGICFGVTYAPILIRRAVLAYVSSEDPKVRNTLGKRRKEWPLLDGDKYVLGNTPPTAEGSRFIPEVEIYIPDALVVRKHATLYSRQSKYYIASHPDNASSRTGAALFAGGRPVDQPYQLNDGDEIRLGRTALRFELRAAGDRR
jgi:hypothetical protein